MKKQPSLKMGRHARLASIMLASLCAGLLSADEVAGFSGASTEAHIRSAMVGTCVQHDKFSSGVELTRIYTYQADGTFKDRGERTESGRIDRFTVTGTWKVQNDSIYYEITSSTHPNIPIGFKNVNRVVSADDDAIVMKTSQGKTVVCARVKRNRAR